MYLYIANFDSSDIFGMMTRSIDKAMSGVGCIIPEFNCIKNFAHNQLIYVTSILNNELIKKI